jgi:hypothetical protein
MSSYISLDVMKKVTNVTISEEVDRAVDSSHFPPIYLPLPYPLAPASRPLSTPSYKKSLKITRWFISETVIRRRTDNTK